jgi:hypothetical protein
MRNKYYIVNFRGVNLLWGKVYSMTGEHSRRMITSATNSPHSKVSEGKVYYIANIPKGNVYYIVNIPGEGLLCGKFHV